MLDWREIFIKYLDAVGTAEGVYFLYEESWPADEWAAIEEAVSELHARLRAK